VIISGTRRGGRRNSLQGAIAQRREERTAALDRMTEEASEAGIYGGRPEDYAAALKKARKHRSQQSSS